MNLIFHDSADLIEDMFAFERFGLDMTMSLSRGEGRTEVAQPRKDEEGYGLPYIPQFAPNWQFKEYGYTWHGMHQYRLDETFTSKDGQRVPFFGDSVWATENGPKSTYLTCEDTKVAIKCRVRSKKHGEHGWSILPVRTIAANFHACWKCLDETLGRGRSGTCADAEHPRAQSMWSPLNGPLRPDMVPAMNGSICIIFDCSVCGAHWFMSPNGPNGGSGCPICAANVSKPQITLQRLLDAALPDERVELEYYVAGYSASDIALVDQRIAIEYDGSRFHYTSEAREKERRKDERLAAAGWRTIRVRENGIGATFHPQTVSIYTEYMPYLQPHVLSEVLRTIEGFGAQVRVDAEAFATGVTTAMRRDVDTELDSRCYAGKPVA